MSDIRFNQWLHQSGTGGVSQDHIGNIGIGTTNPSIVVSAANTAVLNVGVITANNLFVNNAFNGDITGNVTGNISGATGTFSGNVDIADKIIHTGDTDTAMRFPADNTFAVDTAGSERLRITSAGLVGINTASPDRALHVFSTNGTVAHFESGNANEISQIVFEGLGASAPPNLGATGEHLHFTTNNLERVRITSGGDVGIGLTNPFGQLQVRAGTNANFSFTTGGGESSLEIINDAGSANVPLNIRASEYKFKIQGSEKVRISSGGLAINKSAAADAEIEIVQSADPTLRLYDTRNAAYKADFLMAGSGPLIRTNNPTVSDRTLTVQKQLTDHLVIEGNGCVRTPKSVTFFAAGNGGWTNLTGGSKLEFVDASGNLELNDNSRDAGYDTTNSRFTAPVTGLYHFTVCVYVDSSNNGNICAIVPRVNGNQLTPNDTLFFFAFTTNSNSSDQALSGSVSLQLSANDYVEVYRRTGNSGTNRYYKGHSFWQGHLVG